MKNRSYLGKNCFFYFLDVNFVLPKRGHWCEKQPVLRPECGFSYSTLIQHSHTQTKTCSTVRISLIRQFLTQSPNFTNTTIWKINPSFLQKFQKLNPPLYRGVDASSYEYAFCFVVCFFHQIKQKNLLNINKIMGLFCSVFFNLLLVRLLQS